MGQALGPSMDFYSEKLKYLPVVICIFISPTVKYLVPNTYGPQTFGPQLIGPQPIQSPWTNGPQPIWSPYF